MIQSVTAREEAQRRFEAAWNDSLSGGNPPDLDSFLAPFEEPERSAVRAELLELDQRFRRRSGSDEVAESTEPRTTRRTWVRTLLRPHPVTELRPLPRTLVRLFALGMLLCLIGSLGFLFLGADLWIANSLCLIGTLGFLILAAFQRRIIALGLLLWLIGLGGWLITIYFLTENHLRQAQRAFDRQRYPEALEHLNKANSLRPRSPQIHLRLARVYRLLGNFPQADHHLNRCKGLGGGHTEAEQLERLMLRAHTGEVEKVFRQLWVYVEKERPEAPLVLQALAYGFIDQEIYAPARNCVREWLKVDKDNIQALLCDAYLLDINGGGTPEAREDYQRALELDPSRVDVRLRLANAYLNAQRDRDAITHFKEVLRQQPDNEAAQLGLAQATLNLGGPRKVKEAKGMLRNFLEQHPNNVVALRTLGLAEMSENNPDFVQAEEWLREALKKKPTDGMAMHHLVECLKRLGGKDEEVRALTRRMDQLNQDGRRLDDLKRNKLGMQPFNADLCYEIATIYDRLGEEGQAAQWFARALKNNPDHQKALKFAVKYLDKMGDKDQAAELKRRIIKE